MGQRESSAERKSKVNSNGFGLLTASSLASKFSGDRKIKANDSGLEFWNAWDFASKFCESQRQRRRIQFLTEIDDFLTRSEIESWF